MTPKNRALIVTVLIITACAPQRAAVEPTRRVVETAPAIPSVTPVPPSPVPPSPVPTASANLEPIDFDLEPIAVKNAASLTQVVDWKNAEDVSSIDFSPDGQYFLAGLTTGEIKMWKVADGGLMFALPGHSKEVLDVEFSPEGKSIASSSADNTVKLWDATSGEPLKTLEGHSGKVLTVDFSPDGAQLASASLDKTARLWSVEDGSLRHELTGHTEGVSTVAFSRDGSVVATAAKDKTTRIWSTVNGSLVTTLDFSNVSTSAFNLAASFSPSGESLAIRNGYDSSVSLFTTGRYELEKKVTLPGLNNAFFLFSPDGRLLITGSEHSGLNVIEIETGDKLIELVHQDGIRTATISPDGKVLVSIDKSLSLYVWGIRP